MSLGFKEVIARNDTPEDRNIFIIATYNKYEICHEAVFRAQEHKLLFDVRERVLTSINEKWNKAKLFEFVDNPVTPKGLYDEIKGILRQYIEFQRDAHYGLVAAWIMATYFHRCFNAFPFLFFYGKKQCGKSRSLNLLERLTFNAIKTKGISVASLADSIDGIRGTFLNYQAEALSNPKNEEKLGILTDSYTCGGGKRRIVHITNKSRRVVEFETYGPKAFASTKDIEADLKDRCVLIPMVRAYREYPYPEAHLPLWHELRDKLYRLLLTKWKDMKEIYQTTGEGVSHRVKELWRSIETMLRLEDISQAEADSIKSAFLESMQETQTELSDHEIELFETLLGMLKEVKEGVFTAAEISKKLKHDESMNEKALQTWVGKRLTLLSLYIRKAGRKDKKRAYLFNYDHVKNILNRYTQTSGTGGQVVFTQQNQGEYNDHIQNPGGH